MLSQLSNIFSSKGAPSALLVLSIPNVRAVSILHIIPEDGATEQFKLSNTYTPSTIRFRGATEQSREEIGTVMLHTGDGESSLAFLESVADRASKITDRAATNRSTPEEIGNAEVSRWVDDVLKPAAHDAILAIEGRAPSMNAMQLYHVSVVYIKRSKPGRINNLDDFTSI
ncbi:uncharacterized protein TRAVEDRAFT_26711 [Trametes versicolor FP-101664 SS1]|uniref:uncharacterized protein n=1 Tax=Trametes versicolor (strain FP-101664) TaxID=717944 RepID=UPI0004622D2E|nr:uncharacterized protein TRAVEDRAFT_26711 [Trametes versicolor FP-101664 SS1]EIW63442.1 hypothetical protein TRAVEDRAFT_26711 [Trametes versicolor FP-101664 SS1]